MKPRLVWRAASRPVPSRANLVHIVAMRATEPTIYFSYCGKRFEPSQKGFGVGSTVGLNSVCKVCELRHGNEAKRLAQEKRYAEYLRLHPE